MPGRRKVASVLRTSWADDVQVTGQWQLDVMTDAVRWKASEDSPRLTDEIPWFRS